MTHGVQTAAASLLLRPETLDIRTQSAAGPLQQFKIHKICPRANTYTTTLNLMTMCCVVQYGGQRFRCDFPIIHPPLRIYTISILLDIQEFPIQRVR